MRAMSIVGRVVGVVLALAAGSASYVAVEASWGSAVAAAAVVLAIVVIPLVLGRLRLPEGETWLPSAGLRRWARFVVGCCVLALLLLGSTARVSLCDAFRAMPARHPDLGPASRAFARLGAAIGPPSVAPVVPTSSPASAPSASAGSAPTTSGSP
jgi:hypothetical protein